MSTTSGADYPKTIFIIRHGEKPGDPATDNPQDGINLSTRGYERAAALAPYFVATLGKPDALFATQASTHSNRPVETITPLAQALQMTIKSDIADGDYGKLADKILSDSHYAGKVLLICWHHGNIPALTQSLGGQPPQSPWPGTVFDRVWQIDYPAGSGKPSGLQVKNIPQQLLYGDQAT
ncbi:SixA phosphatase family protein [Paraburkholderia acidiphila]|uniref:Histidine phosphatase family protein n=1 Tax=Paraburkholderia acidiphila TaxID=2571747 RepID=A0A7Z2GBT5_9BURK|nr:histidine phosphatase family protein [Paraburkholderia acidiphila]QGZ58933.1 histidine phosphatase family protein [Paraburkholderia acidiphila]